MATGERTEYSDAEFWDRLVQGSPIAALTQAQQLLDSGTLGEHERSLANAAVARSLFETGRHRQALAAARSALDSASVAPRSVRLPVAMSATVILAEAGHVSDALASLDDLARTVEGVELGRVRLQVAYVLHHAGRLNESLAELEAAEQLFARGGEDRDRFRVYHNRGLVLLQQGRLREAEPDFELAESMAAALGLKVAQGIGAANRAVLSGRSRRLAESLHHFERAAALFREAGDPARTVALIEIDRAEVLMHSGLPLDAIAAAQSAFERIEPTGNRMLLGDAQLMLARAELAAGFSRRAIHSARRAEMIFEASGRDDMVNHAAAIRSRSQLVAARREDEAASALRLASIVGERLRRGGWNSIADELALERVRTGVRCRTLAQIAGDVGRLRRGATDGQRHTALAGWYAEAVHCWIDEDLTGANAACMHGLDLLDDIVAEADTLERRSAAMQLGHDLSQLTIEVAVARSDADTVLAAAEGTRARALHHELTERDRHEPLTEDGAGRLRHELSARLGDRTLVEWIIVRDVVWAVVFDATGSRLTRVAPREDVVRARDRLNVWLDLAAAEPDAGSGRAMRAARLLDELLIAPLRLPPDTGVVVVPVDILHEIPWSGLPSLSSRPLTLAPNAQVWLEADRRAVGHLGSIALVVGPDVDEVAAERAAVERHGGVAIAAGAGAGAATVRSMFAGSGLVHLAAHGTFRSDHPLLSTVRLHDGEATLYDVLPERVGAKLVVLSSCEGGAQGTADGSEVLGMSAVLLARGAAAVLAPLTVVRDLECAEFVAEVHDELRAGASLSRSVAAVRRRWLGDDDLSRWAVASSFTCFGSGAVSLAH